MVIYAKSPNRDLFVNLTPSTTTTLRSHTGWAFIFSHKSHHCFSSAKNPNTFSPSFFNSPQNDNLQLLYHHYPPHHQTHYWTKGYIISGRDRKAKGTGSSIHYSSHWFSCLICYNLYPKPWERRWLREVERRLWGERINWEVGFRGWDYILPIILLKKLIWPTRCQQLDIGLIYTINWD